jgi:hypothetical protein
LHFNNLSCFTFFECRGHDKWKQVRHFDASDFARCFDDCEWGCSSVFERVSVSAVSLAPVWSRLIVAALNAFSDVARDSSLRKQTV